MKITYKTQGTCSSHIEVEVEDDVVQQVFFWGGCNGNLQGISRLVKGMKVEDVISKLEGVKCGNRSTSCPDQLCKALREMEFTGKYDGNQKSKRNTYDCFSCNCYITYNNQRQIFIFA